MIASVGFGCFTQDAMVIYLPLFNDSASGRLLVGGLVVGSGRRKRAGVQP